MTHPCEHLERCPVGFCRKGYTKNEHNSKQQRCRRPRTCQKRHVLPPENVVLDERTLVSQEHVHERGMSQQTRTSNSRCRPSPGLDRQRVRRSQRQQRKPHLQRIDGRCCTKGKTVSKLRTDGESAKADVRGANTKLILIGIDDDGFRHCVLPTSQTWEKDIGFVWRKESTRNAELMEVSRKGHKVRGP